MLMRYSGSASAAAAMTFGLLLLMQYLVATPGADVLPVIKVGAPDLPNVRESTDTQIKPPPPEKIEPAEPTPDTDIDPGRVNDYDPLPVDFTTRVTGGGEGPIIDPGVADSDFIPVAKVFPRYPESARTRGLSGYVIVEFTITATGRIENARVIESSHRVFEKPAIEAILRFRYKPRTVHGQGVAVSGVQHRFTFEIER